MIAYDLKISEGKLHVKLESSLTETLQRTPETKIVEFSLTAAECRGFAYVLLSQTWVPDGTVQFIIPDADELPPLSIHLA